MWCTRALEVWSSFGRGLCAPICIPRRQRRRVGPSRVASISRPLFPDGIRDMRDRSDPPGAIACRGDLETRAVRYATPLYANDAVRRTSTTPDSTDCADAGRTPHVHVLRRSPGPRLRIYEFTNAQDLYAGPPGRAPEPHPEPQLGQRLQRHTTPHTSLTKGHTQTSALRTPPSPPRDLRKMQAPSERIKSIDLDAAGTARLPGSLRARPSEQSRRPCRSYAEVCRSTPFRRTCRPRR
jgi:hypothetical protein